MLMVSILKHLVCLRSFPSTGCCRQHPSSLWSQLSKTIASVSPTPTQFHHIPFVYAVRRLNTNIRIFSLPIDQNIRSKSGQRPRKQEKLQLSTHPKSKLFYRSSKRFFVSPISHKDDDCGDPNSKIMPKRNKPKVYAVAVGREPGLYTTWDACQAQVKGYSNAKFKGFTNTKEAQFFLQQHNVITTVSNNPSSQSDIVFGPSDNNKKRKQEEIEASTSPTEEHAFSSADPSDPKEPHCYDNQTDSLEGVVLPLRSTIIKLSFHINFDGGSRGNPKGVAGSGAHIVTRIQYRDVEAASAPHILRRKTSIRKFLGEDTMTNNQAEYLGAIAGLEHVLQTLQQVQSHLSTKGTTVHILIQGDSNLVIQQLLGNWECKNPNMRFLLSRARAVVKDVEQITSSSDSLLEINYEHVYRHDNAIADGLANAAMDAKKSWTTTLSELESSGDAENVEKRIGKIVHL
jgi:ribonuclease HI